MQQPKDSYTPKLGKLRLKQTPKTKLSIIREGIELTNHKHDGSLLDNIFQNVKRLLI